MVATSMPSIDWLLKKLKATYPQLTFQSGDTFAWQPQSSTITFAAEGDSSLLLHELGHALLGHSSYRRDIELLSMERQAWSKAQEIANQLEITIDSETHQDHLETYRIWLHERSLCPNCGLNGLQDSETTYRCLSCRSRWQVNEARTCQLKRKIITTK